MNREEILDWAEKRAEELKPEILHISHQIFQKPEPAFEEFEAAGLLQDTVEARGFDTVRGEGKLRTAIRADHGSQNETLKIAFLSEYDALPNGHSCGHNLIAASGCMAAVIFDELVRKFELPAESIFLGTPAEEGGGGKIMMLDAGMFAGIDYAMMIHPCDSTMVEDWSLAGQNLIFRFHGRSAHCAASPWLGANALAAATESVNMVNAWRSQWKDYTRVFPNITHGGEATNVIPDFAEVKFNVRSDDKEYHRELVSTVERCARCAAEAFGVTVETEKTFAYDPIANDKTLEKYMREAFTRLGENVIPRYRDHGIGSTDMGNVSCHLPAIHGHLFLADENTHTTRFRKAAGGEEGDIYVMKAVKAMVFTAVGLATDEEVLAKNRPEKGN